MKENKKNPLEGFVEVKGLPDYRAKKSNFLPSRLIGNEVKVFQPEGFIDDAILDRAIKEWGFESQVSMIEEECLELALAIQKLNRRCLTSPDIAIENVIDEIADVKIMIRQAEKLFDSKRINSRVSFKMQRLDERLKKLNS